MTQQQDKLLPGEALIYERSNGVVYAHYRDKPEIPRWIIGGDPGAVARAQGKLLDYSEWLNLCELSQSNITLKKQMEKLVNTYHIVKNESR